MMVHGLVVEGGGEKKGIAGIVGTLGMVGMVGMEGIGGNVSVGMVGMAGSGGSATFGTIGMTAGNGGSVGLLRVGTAGIGGNASLGSVAAPGSGGSVSFGMAGMVGSAGGAATVGVSNRRRAAWHVVVVEIMSVKRRHMVEMWQDLDAMVVGEHKLLERIEIEGFGWMRWGVN